MLAAWIGAKQLTGLQELNFPGTGLSITHMGVDGLASQDLGVKAINANGRESQCTGQE